MNLCTLQQRTKLTQRMYLCFFIRLPFSYFRGPNKLSVPLNIMYLQSCADLSDELNVHVLKMAYYVFNHIKKNSLGDVVVLHRYYFLISHSFPKLFNLTHKKIFYESDRKNASMSLHFKYFSRMNADKIPSKIMPYWVTF